MADPLANMSKLLMQKQADKLKPVGEGMEYTDDWRNPGQFWHPQSGQLPASATENPDFRSFYRIVPSPNHPGQLMHTGQEGVMMTPEWDASNPKNVMSLLKLMQQLHQLNLMRQQTQGVQER